MRDGFKLNVGSRRLLRPLVSFVIAPAFVIQSFLIAVGGLPAPAGPGEITPGFELCLHDTSGTPGVPAGKPDYNGCTHCIFCFAGAYHALFRNPPILFGRVTLAAVIVRWLGNERSVERRIRNAIANPRGPPGIA
jgi:hypothetical protein